MMSVKHLIREEIKNELEALSHLEVGTEQYKVAAEGIASLLNKYNEMEKNEIDFEEKVRCREFDIDLKREQMEAERKDRFYKNCLTAVGTGLYAGLMIWGTNKAMRFEKEDSFTSQVGRGWISKIPTLIKSKF